MRIIISYYFEISQGTEDWAWCADALFMVILHAYADPKTDECQREVLILSMIVVGPKEYATAWQAFVSEAFGSVMGTHTYIPKAAAVPLVLVAQFTRHTERKTPAPQRTTTIISVSTIFPYRL